MHLEVVDARPSACARSIADRGKIGLVAIATLRPEFEAALDRLARPRHRPEVPAKAREDLAIEPLEGQRELLEVEVGTGQRVEARVEHLRFVWPGCGRDIASVPAMTAPKPVRGGRCPHQTSATTGPSAAKYSRRNSVEVDVEQGSVEVEQHGADHG